MIPSLRTLYTCSLNAASVPTHRSGRVYYGFPTYSEALAHAPLYGDSIFEVKANLPTSAQEGYAWSSGAGDAADAMQGWGENERGWVSYPSKYVRNSTLIDSTSALSLLNKAL